MNNNPTTVYLTHESEAYINWKVYSEKLKGNKVSMKEIMNQGIMMKADSDLEYREYLKDEK